MNSFSPADWFSVVQILLHSSARSNSPPQSAILLSSCHCLPAAPGGDAHCGGPIMLQRGQTSAWQKRRNNANALRRLMRRLFCVVTWACVTVAALSLFYYHAYTAWLAADSEQILLAAGLSARQNHCNSIVVVVPQGFVFEPRRFLVDAVDSCSSFFFLNKNNLPFTTSRADVFWRSTQNMKVPVSSIDRFETVRLWTFPLALIRKWFVCLSWIPFLIHVPTTWGWESSTSKVAVSLSVVLISVRPLLIVIFRAARIFWGRGGAQQY